MKSCHSHDIRTFSEQRDFAPIYLFWLLPQSHIRCCLLAEDAGVGKCSPESYILTGKDHHHSMWEQGSGKGMDGWHMTSVTAGLNQLWTTSRQFSPSQRLCSKQLESKWPGWAQLRSLDSDQQNTSSPQRRRAVFPWEHRGEASGVKLRITQRWVDVEILYVCAKKHLTLLKLAANLGTVRRQIAVLVTKYIIPALLQLNSHDMLQMDVKNRTGLM